MNLDPKHTVYLPKDFLDVDEYRKQKTYEIRMGFPHAWKGWWHNQEAHMYWAMNPEPSKTFEARLEEVVKALMQ